MYTEFVSVDGLCSQGRSRLLRELTFIGSERPLIIQLFGRNPDHFFRCAQLAVELGFDGIDINTGCPDRAVMRQGAGAALIKEPELLARIVEATRAGAGELPVSIKTRIGFDRDITEAWIAELVEMRPVAIAIHARTARELSKVDAHWDAIGRAVSVAAGSGIKIIGNGDLRDLQDAGARIADTGADGALLGRAIFGNPWLFNRTVSKQDLPLEQVLEVMLDHARVFVTELGFKNFAVMRRHFKAYVGGFTGAKELRMALMETLSLEETEHVIRDWLSRQPTADHVRSTAK